MRHLRIAIALAWLLAGCNDFSPDRQPGFTLPELGEMLRPTHTAPNVPATGASKIMQDPSAEGTEDGIEVRAGNITEANSRCQEQADRLTNRSAVVTCLGCRVRTLTTDKYICTLKTEWL
jgi:hypothetical protein